MKTQSTSCYSAVEEFKDEIKKCGVHFVCTTDSKKCINLFKNIQIDLLEVDLKTLNQDFQNQILVLKIPSIIINSDDFIDRLNNISISNTSIWLLVEFEKFEYASFENELPIFKSEYLQKWMKYNFISISLIDNLGYELDNKKVVVPLVVCSLNLTNLEIKFAWFYEENENFILDSNEVFKIIQKYYSNE